jgi:hypothetical protein
MEELEYVRAVVSTTGQIEMTVLWPFATPTTRLAEDIRDIVAGFNELASPPEPQLLLVLVSGDRRHLIVEVPACLNEIRGAELSDAVRAAMERALGDDGPTNAVRAALLDIRDGGPSVH